MPRVDIKKVERVKSAFEMVAKFYVSQTKSIFCDPKRHSSDEKALKEALKNMEETLKEKAFAIPVSQLEAFLNKFPIHMK